MKKNDHLVCQTFKNNEKKKHQTISVTTPSLQSKQKQYTSLKRIDYWEKLSDITRLKSKSKKPPINNFMSKTDFYYENI